MKTITIVNKETGEKKELTTEQLSQFMSQMAAQIKAQEEMIAEIKKQIEWQSISTAPKNGKPILLLDSDKRKFVGFWLSQVEVDDLDVWDCEPLEAGFYLENYMGDHCERLDPTHWMPLPKSPEET